MKRSGPPERRTPLARGDSQLARTPMPRTSLERARELEQTRRERAAATARSNIVPPQRREKAKPERGSADREPARPAAPRDTGPNSTVRRRCKERDRGLCVRCGAPATNLQHRQGRGTGGRGVTEAERTNRPAWLLSLCGQGNTSGCHAWCDDDRATAKDHGYVIPRNGVPVDAEKQPVLTADGWQLFLNDGTRVPCDPPEV